MARRTRASTSIERRGVERRGIDIEKRKNLASAERATHAIAARVNSSRKRG